MLESGFESRTPPFASIFSIKPCRLSTSTPKVMDGGPFAYQFCFLVVFVVIDHQREVYIAVR